MTSPAQLHQRPPRLSGLPVRGGTVLGCCLAAAACAVVVTACGTAAAPGPAAARSGGATQVAAAKVSLDVTIYPATYPATSSTAPQVHYVLRCEPAGGTVPDPAVACARLLAGQDLFAPQPTHVMCPMILAGAAHAVIYGSYLGRPVTETIADGGCDLTRWAKVTQVFPLPTN